MLSLLMISVWFRLLDIVDLILFLWLFFSSNNVFVLSYQPFTSYDYDFSVYCLLNLGYDQPSAATLCTDLENAGLLVDEWITNIFSFILLYTMEYDLWSYIAKDAILSVMLYFLNNRRRHKLLLDTLLLVNEINHDRNSYSQSITSIPPCKFTSAMFTVIEWRSHFTINLLHINLTSHFSDSI